MDNKNEELDLSSIRKSFYLSDNERKIIDLSDKLKFDLALQLRSKRGSKKVALENIKKDSKRILLLNETFKPYFVNISIKNNRLSLDSEINPFLPEFVKKYPIIVDGYALSENNLEKCTLSSGVGEENLKPSIIVKEESRHYNLNNNVFSDDSLSKRIK